MKDERNHSFFNFGRLNKRSLNLIFIPALALMLCISFFLYHEIKILITANQWVLHTEEVIQKTDSILYEMIDIESHQRGFLITGNNEYLAKIDTGKLALQKILDELAVLTKDNPEQARRVSNFTTLIDKRIQMLKDVAQLKMENKFNTDNGFSLFNHSQEVSTQAKGLGQEIKSVESVLLYERNIRAIDNASNTNAVLIIGSSLSTLLLLLAFVLVGSELSIRQLVEIKNKKAQVQLRSIIDGARDMIAAFDKDNRFIIFNEPYYNEFKHLFKKSIAIGMSLEEALREASMEKNDLALAWKNSLLSNENNQNIEWINEVNEKIVYELMVSFMHNDRDIEGTVHIIRNISKRVNQHIELQKSYQSLALGMTALQEKNEQISLLVEMSDIMLACSSQEELSHVMSKYSTRMLKFASGFLYVMHPSKNYLEIISNWGEPTTQMLTFIPDQCWAIRRGRVHLVNINHEELICHHINQPKESKILMCVPLMAQNDIYGLLYLEFNSAEDTHLEDHKLLINAFSELTALALANVRLRENLRYQSIRDPLTSLYNRRYLEDFLFKQLHQAERTKVNLSILMFDLDHFKKINDTYGHDAGDAALKEFGRILQNDIRISDVASRYGGEEFIVVLYDTNAQGAKKLADKIRESFSMAQIHYGAQVIGPLSVSIGISEYPNDGKTLEELIEAADRALYFAKNNGRDRAVLCSEIKQLKSVG